MVRALLSQPVGLSVPSAPPPGVVVVVVSPPSSLALLSPPLLLPPVSEPAVEPGVAPPDLLPPQPALSKTDVRARAQVSESTFRNIAIVVWCQSCRRAGTLTHLLTNDTPRSQEAQSRNATLEH